MSRLGIPRSLRKYIRNHPKYGEEVYQQFRKWYSKNIRGEGSRGAKIFEDFSEALQGAGITDAAQAGRRRYSVNQSHIQPHKLGGSGHTFLEYWAENQRRSASERAGKPFINPELMKEAGLPRNWIELFHFWDLEQQGQITSLGKLADINPDDLIALHRNDPVNKVFQRREALDQMLELAVNDPSTITQNQSTYAELFAKSRGLNPQDTREISLRQHAGWTLDDQGNYIQKAEEDSAADFFARSTERMGGEGINYESLGDLQPESEITGASELDPRMLDPEFQMEGRAIPDHSILSITPAGKLLNPIRAGLTILNNPTVKQNLNKIRKSDFVQNLGKDKTDASRLQKTVKSKGIKQDQALGELIKQQDKLINQSYQEIINPQRAVELINEEFDPNKSYFKGNR